jgi:hypothetical protein
MPCPTQRFDSSINLVVKLPRSSRRLCAYGYTFSYACRNTFLLDQLSCCLSNAKWPVQPDACHPGSSYFPLVSFRPITQRGGINSGLPFVLYHIRRMLTTMYVFGGDRRGILFYALFYNGLRQSTDFFCVWQVFFGGRRFWSLGSLFWNSVGVEAFCETDVLCVCTSYVPKISNMLLWANGKSIMLLCVCVVCVQWLDVIVLLHGGGRICRG